MLHFRLELVNGIIDFFSHLKQLGYTCYDITVSVLIDSSGRGLFLQAVSTLTFCALIIIIMRGSSSFNSLSLCRDSVLSYCMSRL